MGWNVSMGGIFESKDTKIKRFVDGMLTHYGRLRKAGKTHEDAFEAILLDDAGIPQEAIQELKDEFGYCLSSLSITHVRARFFDGRPLLDMPKALDSRLSEIRKACDCLKCSPPVPVRTEEEKQAIARANKFVFGE